MELNKKAWFQSGSVLERFFFGREQTLHFLQLVRFKNAIISHL